MSLGPQDWAQLRTAPLFSGLQVTELSQALSHARIRMMKAGETLFQENDAARAFYFVASGGMRLFKLAPDGNEKVIEIIGSGETFAEAVVFLGGRYPVYAAALAATRLVEIDTADFMRTLKSNNALAMKMLAGVSMRLHHLINDVRALSLESAGQRVSGYLLEHCAETSASVLFELPAHKNVIASRLGLKPETFSRTLSALRDLGLIEIESARIHIPDPVALRRWRERDIQ